MKHPGWFIAFLLPVLLPLAAGAQEHFDPVQPTGMPYAVIVDSALYNGLLLGEGDELGLFDGDLCVGADLAPTTRDDWPVNVTAWRADPGHGMPGYTHGHTIIFKVYDQSSGVEAIAEATLEVGNGLFGYNPYTLAWLQAGPGDLPTSFSLSSPADSSEHDSLTIHLVWTASEDPGETVSYTVYAGAADEEHLPQVVSGLNAPEYVLTVEDNSETRWTVRANDENSGGRWADQVFLFSVAVPEPPAPFALTLPEDEAGFTRATLDPLTFIWTESNDPDPGEEVGYELRLHVDGDIHGGPDLDYTVTGLDTTSATLDSLIEWLSPYPVTDSVRVSWWVLALSGSDTVTCEQAFEFVVLPDDAVRTHPSSLPQAFSVSACYPNPFNSSTRLKVALPHAAVVEVQAVNVLGRKVARLASGRFPAGNHRVSFDANRLPSGIYFVQATVPGRLHVVRKVALIR